MNKEDYNKYYIQGSDHYLIPKDVFKELFNEMINWKEETKELKKQLEDISEELELVRCDLHNRTSERDGYERELNECLSQQKEFIKYLEDEKDRLAREVSQIYEDSLGKTKLVNEDIFNEVNNVLSKYNEILSKGENK